jgi:hypothetical protein
VKCEKATNWAGSSNARTQPENLFRGSASTCEKKPIPHGWATVATVRREEWLFADSADRRIQF